MSAKPTQHAAVVGAGVAGLCSALALSRAGFQVTVLERDVPPPDGDAEQAFFAWQRRGAAQFRHPHAFLGLMCSLLQERYPDLLDAFFAAGARKLTFADMVPPHLKPDYKPAPGDDQLWMLLCRRATLETVLRQYVQRQNSVTINNTQYVTGLLTSQNPLTVTGLQVTRRDNNNEQLEQPYDVVIDATGRTSKFPRWLEAQGAHVEEQRDDAEIVYYTRHYQLLPGVEEPDRHKEDPSAGDLGYMKYGVFPGDSGHFALIVCLPNHETQLRDAIKTAEGFDSVCRTIPGLVPWIAEDRASPTTAPFGIGQIHSVWRNFLDADEQPLARNFFAVGDSAVRTNPLYGRGCSTGILHAHLLAEALTETNDPVQRAQTFHHLTHERLRPIFNASLSEDKNGIRRAEAVLQGQSVEKASTIKQYLKLAFGDALAWAARYDIDVFRGMMRTVNLVENPGDFLKDKQTRRTVFGYMLRGRKRNAKARVQRGLSRTQMMQHVDELASS